MHDPTPSYLLPKAALLRWLADPGLDLPDDVRVRLLATLSSSLASLALGALAMLAVELAAAIRHPGPLFLGLLAADLTLLAARIGIILRARRAVAENRPAPTDLLLASSVAWAGMVGTMTLLCFLSGDPLLQILAPLTMMGILSGIVTRNYAAPRLAVAMIVLCDMPLKIALPLYYGDAWFLLAAGLGLIFAVATGITTVRLNHTYVEVLLAKRENQRRATHDPLTGLLNRTGLMDGLAARLPAGDKSLALLYLDLDGFKAVNDCFGHGVGDALLIEVAGRIAAAIPPDWEAARLGGDEFVILAGGDRAHEAAIVAAHLIEAVKAPCDLGPDCPGGLGIGVSVGIAWAAPGMEPAALLAEADAALYRAKAAGKGRWAAGPVPASRDVRVG